MSISIFISGTNSSRFSCLTSYWLVKVSVEGVCLILFSGVGSGPIYWSSKKEADISLSSVEVEYRGVINITIQTMWLQHFLIELGIQFHQSIVILCDNQSTLKFCRDPVQR